MTKIKKCPNCDAELNNNTIKFFEDGIMIYSINIDGDMIEYEQDEFEDDGKFGFFCKECSEDLDLTEKDVIDILKCLK